ncbi:unnamed protein product [Phytophthora lilii]|uniref:Unnamed protein product n=1 Tax=Phytophthora lilii TaxID=2077276 RepID=A0A9W6X2G4_9STRA|nr:unnamed protein product [Phytophthora lilii]
MNKRKLTIPGSDRTLWQWSASNSISSILEASRQNPFRELPRLQIEEVMNTAHEATLIVSTPLRVGIKVPYLATSAGLDEFSSRFCKATSKIQQIDVSIAAGLLRHR